METRSAPSSSSPESGIKPAQALSWGKAQYQRAGQENLSELRLILEEILRGSLLWQGRQPLSTSQWARFQQIVEARLAGKPLQHLLGKMWFYGLELKSAPGCFIVRPETETLVGAATGWLREKMADANLGGQPIRGVDLCTGSAAIPLALVQENDWLQMKAVEISAAALAVARQNLARYPDLAARIDLVQQDATRFAASETATYQLVVSNPPYVPPGEVKQTEARQDPALALYGGGTDGTKIPRLIIENAYQVLTPGGLLVMEHDPRQAPILTDYARKIGFKQVKTGKDLTGRARYLWAES